MQIRSLATVLTSLLTFTTASAQFEVSSFTEGEAQYYCGNTGAVHVMEPSVLEHFDDVNYAMPNPDNGFAAVRHHLFAESRVDVNPQLGNLSATHFCHTICDPSIIETHGVVNGQPVTNHFIYSGLASSSAHAWARFNDTLTVTSDTLAIGTPVLISCRIRATLSFPTSGSGASSPRPIAYMYVPAAYPLHGFSGNISGETRTERVEVAVQVGYPFQFGGKVETWSGASAGLFGGSVYQQNECISLVSADASYNIDVLAPGVTLSSASGKNYSLGTPGDADHSGAVNFNDLLVLAQNYGTPTDATWEMGDFTFDGAVNFPDLLALAQHYGAGSLAATDGVGSSQFRTDWQLAASMVPEPALAALVAIAVVTNIRARPSRRLSPRLCD